MNNSNKTFDIYFMSEISIPMQTADKGIDGMIKGKSYKEKSVLIKCLHNVL